MAALAGVAMVVLSLVAAAFHSYIMRSAPIDAIALTLGPRPKYEGIYARNTRLQSAEKLGEGKLLLPEDVAPDPTGKFLYVSTADGWIKKLYLADGSVENWKHVGGRPLGLAVGNLGELLVCEPYHGLLKVTDDGVETLATQVDGAKLLLVDSVTVAADGLVYFTDVSTKYTLDIFEYDFFEGRPNGRILVYDPSSNTTRILLEDLFFPNGIVLSRDESCLLFAETSKGRISRHYLKGDRRGETETLNEVLPGFPDNIRWNAERDALYVGIIAGPRNAVLDLLWRVPFLKSLITLYPALQKQCDNSYKWAGVLAIDEDGTPLKWYEDPVGKTLAFATVAYEVDGFLYVGGLRDDFVGRIKA